MAHNKTGYSTPADNRRVKLDKQMGLKFSLRHEEQNNRSDKLGDVVVKKQTFNYGVGGDTGCIGTQAA